MAIYRLLQEANFGPDQIARMAGAYEITLAKLGLIDRTDPLTELVASKVIHYAKTGERDPVKICESVLEDLGAKSIARS